MPNTDLSAMCFTSTKSHCISSIISHPPLKGYPSSPYSNPYALCSHVFCHHPHCAVCTFPYPHHHRQASGCTSYCLLSSESLAVEPALIGMGRCSHIYGLGNSLVLY